jgi:hypothetical protein
MPASRLRQWLDTQCGEYMIGPMSLKMIGWVLLVICAALLIVAYRQHGYASTVDLMDQIRQFAGSSVEHERPISYLYALIAAGVIGLAGVICLAVSAIKSWRGSPVATTAPANR